MEPVRIALIGIGGMGGYHLKCLMETPDLKLVAVCEKNIEREDVIRSLAVVKEHSIPTYDDYVKMLEGIDAEAVLVATPHFFHVPMAMAALERGFHVFCEKPPAPVASECDKMLKAKKKHKKLVGIHFQSTGVPSAVRLKELISAGELGRIKEIVTTMFWYRAEEYYSRSPWAGKKKVGESWCLDGVMMNQSIHYLNQSLFFASPSPAPAVARAGAVRSALYRAHATPALEMEDIACLKVEVEGGVKFYFYGTTCARELYELRRDTVEIEVVGERGKAIWDGKTLTVSLDGREPATFEAPVGPNYMHVNFVRAIREGEKLHSPLQEAVKCIPIVEGAYRSANWNIKKVTWSDVAGLHEVLKKASANRCLPGELPDRPGWA